MRAIVISNYGGPEVLVESELPDPVPGEGEVLIRVKAFGLNHAECYFRSGAWGEVANVIFQRARRENGWVARGEEQPVAFTQRNLQQLGEMQDQLSAGNRATRLDVTQVTARHLCHQGEVLLRQAFLAPPLFQQGSYGHRR